MTKRMLIDASHAEETRVVVLDGNRLEDFDVETASRRQLKGNIYLAKIVRVEPSLQAAFVEYGGNRHGFLAFGEIHPDYYQIPVADRQRLLAMQEEEARAEEEAEDAHARAAESAEAPSPDFSGDETSSGETSGDEPSGAQSDGDHSGEVPHRAQPMLIEHEIIEGPAPEPAPVHEPSEDAITQAAAPEAEAATDPVPEEPAAHEAAPSEQAPEAEVATPAVHAIDPAAEIHGADIAPEASEPASSDAVSAEPVSTDSPEPQAATDEGSRVESVAEEQPPEPATIGGENDTNDEGRERRPQSRALRSYKIQEVIRRRQILLVQVVKEERGTKGAALTTFISLAGRYCVLMPNSPRGGGISRKITSASDRRRLKEVTAELEIPRGMGLIVRTAGAARPKPEIKRDCEYLLRLWDDIRDQTMASMAPALIYEEASLIKRAIRDVYSRDVDELLIDGEDGWRTAREFMRMLMPTHVKKVELWRQSGQPLFAHQNVEAMLDAMLSPTVQLRSGGYLVINQTEALVAIDVNSGRSTRERGIEETALRTNLEAAEEAARQLRLRDLAGLIVIDFIDMESKKHNAMVERRMADALKNDRARIQVGHISHFGLMELSRQRLRPSLAETSLNICEHCGGTGHVRSTESAALHVLRAIEEEGGKRRAAEILVHVAGDAALYILNNKRQRLTEIENRYAMRVCFAADPTLLPAQTRIDRVRAQTADLPPPETGVVTQHDDTFDEPTAAELAADADVTDDRDEDDQADSPEANPSSQSAASHASDPDAVPGETAEEGERRRKRRRRRRGRGRRDEAGATPLPNGAEQPDIHDPAFAAAPDETTPQFTAPADSEAPNSVEPISVGPLSAGPLSAEPNAAEMPPSADTPPVPGHDEAGEAAAETEAEHAPKRRRGGRRRKPRAEDAESPALPLNGAEPTYAPAPYVSAYVGPTPADPFSAGHLDIFDVLDQHENRHVQTAVAQPYAPVPPAPMAPAPVPHSVAPPADIPPAAVAEAAAPAPAEEPEGPASAPVIQPVLVGAAEPAERKRGWWRR